MDKRKERRIEVDLVSCLWWYLRKASIYEQQQNHFVLVGLNEAIRTFLCSGIPVYLSSECLFSRYIWCIIFFMVCLFCQPDQHTSSVVSFSTTKVCLWLILQWKHGRT